MKGFTLCSFVLAQWNIGRMKRRPSTAAEGEPAQKRSVTYETFKKWRTDLDRDHQTVSWLDCDTVSEGRKKVVQRLKCSVCSKFKASIRGRPISTIDGSSVRIPFGHVSMQNQIVIFSTVCIYNYVYVSCHFGLLLGCLVPRSVI